MDSTDCISSLCYWFQRFGWKWKTRLRGWRPLSYACARVCLGVDPDGRRAKKGGQSGREAVKESSGYKDQTAGQTTLKATAAAVLKV